MTIKYNQVTWYSQLAAIILFVGIFYLGFYLGQKFGYVQGQYSQMSPAVLTIPNAPIATATYICSGGKTIMAAYYTNDVQLILSDKRALILPHVISGSGARYANTDESVVFWNKGNTAFIDETAGRTYDGCTSGK